MTGTVDWTMGIVAFEYVFADAEGGVLPVEATWVIDDMVEL